MIKEVVDSSVEDFFAKSRLPKRVGGLLEVSSAIGQDKKAYSDSALQDFYLALELLNQDEGSFMSKGGRTKSSLTLAPKQIEILSEHALKLEDRNPIADSVVLLSLTQKLVEKRTEANVKNLIVLLEYFDKPRDLPRDQWIEQDEIIEDHAQVRATIIDPASDIFRAIRQIYGNEADFFSESNLIELYEVKADVVDFLILTSDEFVLDFITKFYQFSLRQDYSVSKNLSLGSLSQILEPLIKYHEQSESEILDDLVTMQGLLGFSIASDHYLNASQTEDELHLIARFALNAELVFKELTEHDQGLNQVKEDLLFVRSTNLLMLSQVAELIRNNPDFKNEEVDPILPHLMYQKAGEMLSDFEQHEDYYTACLRLSAGSIRDDFSGHGKVREFVKSVVTKLDSVDL